MQVGKAKDWWERRDVGSQFNAMINEIQCRFDHFVAQMTDGQQHALAKHMLADHEGGEEDEREDGDKKSSDGDQEKAEDVANDEEGSNEIGASFDLEHGGGSQALEWEDSPRQQVGQQRPRRKLSRQPPKKATVGADEDNGGAAGVGWVAVLGEERVRVLTVAWAKKSKPDEEGGSFSGAVRLVSDFIGLPRGSVAPEAIPHLKRHQRRKPRKNRSANGKDPPQQQQQQQQQ